MRGRILIAFGVLALVAAGIAVAHDNQGESVKLVSATFTATTATNVKTSSCVGTDGTYASASGEYAGTATSTDPTLAGPVTVDATSLINTTTGAGTVNGTLRIDTTGGGHTMARFDAVYSNGSVTGLAEGGTGGVASKLIANLASDYTAAGGFANGQLGGPTSHGGMAIELTQGGCQQPRPEKVEAHGAVTAVSSTSITAAGVTCVVPSNLQTAVSSIHTGDFVNLECTVSGGVTTLDQVSAGNAHGDNGHHGDSHHDGARKGRHHH